MPVDLPASSQDLVAAALGAQAAAWSVAVRGDLLIANPTLAAAPVDILFLKSDGGTVVQQMVPPPTSRTTIAIDAIAGLEAAEVSAMVTSTDKVRSARCTSASRCSARARNRRGSLHRRRRGSTPREHRRLLHDVPVAGESERARRAHVTLTYLPAAGAPVTVQHEIPAFGRRTINVSLEDPSLADAAVAAMAARIETDLPIVVERSMYWPGTPGAWHDAHNSAGLTDTGPFRDLAEDRVGDLDAHQTYILLANPDDQAVAVLMHFPRANGTTVQREYSTACSRCRGSNARERNDAGTAGRAVRDAHPVGNRARTEGRVPLGVRRKSVIL